MKSIFSSNYLFLLSVLSFIVGISSSSIISIYFFIICFVIAFVLFLFFKEKQSNVVLIILIFLSLGGVRAYIQKMHKASSISVLSNFKKPVVSQLTVVKQFHDFKDTRVYKVKLHSVDGKILELKGLIYFPKDLGKLKIGESYVSHEQIYILKNTSHVYIDSYQKYLEANHLYYKIYLRKPPLLLKNKRYGWLKSFDFIKRKISKGVESYHLSSKVEEFLKAFVLGDRLGLSAELKNDFKNAGLMHILAISGLHIGILHQLLLLLFRNTFYLYKHRWVKSFLILIILWGYVYLVGFTISVVRAAAMFTLFEICSKIYREQHPLDVLFFFVFSMVIIDPVIVIDVGFQLSVVAVLSIVLGLPLWMKWWTPRKFWLLKLWQLLGVTILAQLGLLPLLVHYFHQFPSLFLLSNIPVLLVLPVVFVITVLIVLLSLFSFKIEWFVNSYDWLISSFLKYVAWVSSFENTILISLKLDALGVFLAYAGIFFLLGCYYKSRLGIKQLVLLLSVFICYLITNKIYEIQKNDYWIIEEHNELFLVDRFSRQLRLYTNTSKELEDIRFLNKWKQTAVFTKIEKIKLQNIYSTKDGKSIRLINNSCCYGINDGDVCIIDNTPKLNLERVLKNNPSLIIFTANNKGYVTSKYLKSCREYNIAVWDMEELGSFNLKTD